MCVLNRNWNIIQNVIASGSNSCRIQRKFYTYMLTGQFGWFENNVLLIDDNFISFVILYPEKEEMK